MESEKEKKVMDDVLKIIIDFFKIIILIPLIILGIIVIALFAIFYVFFSTYQWIINKIKIKKLLKINEGQIFLIYADYNNIDLENYIQKNHKNVKCFQTIKNINSGVLESHLIRENYSKSYPRLTKIENGVTIHKEHYNSFKHFVKRNNDIESFYSLLDKSIQNLKK